MGIKKTNNTARKGGKKNSTPGATVRRAQRTPGPRAPDGYDRATAKWRTDNLGGRGPMQSAPVSQARTVRTKAPVMQTMRNGDCRVTHREYIQDILAANSAPSAFQATQFALNPGQVATFPWLSSVAKNFESYRFRKLKFFYETEAPSSLGGSLVQSVDYDATDAAPLTKQQAMAYRNAVRSAPWEPCAHTSAQEDLNKRKTYYVRPGALPRDQAGNPSDIKMYDTGNLFVCTQNVTTASAVCGELYVEYDVDLMTPIWENLAGTSGILAAIGATGQAAAAPFGSNPSAGTGVIQLSNAGALVVAVEGMVVGQEYAVAYALDGNTITGGGAVTSATGMTIKSLLSGINAVGTSTSATLTVTATATSGTITLGAITAAAILQSVFVMALIPTQAY